MKTKDQVQQQYDRIMAQLWRYDCRIPGNVERRNKRMSIVNLAAARRIYPDAFKKPMEL